MSSPIVHSDRMRATTTPWQHLPAHNRRVLLEVLRRGPLSRRQLADRLGLSPGSLTRLTKPMLASGLLVEGTASTHGVGAMGGRPQIPLDVARELQLFAGVSITSTAIDLVLTDVHARVLRGQRAPLRETSPSGVVDRVAAMLSSLAADRAPGDATLTHVGVAIGGSVPDGRTVQQAPFLDWHGVPLADELESATGLTARVDNDLAALTEAENWFGAGREHDQFIVVTFGMGVGFGAVSHRAVIGGPEEGRGLSSFVRVAGPGGTPMRIDEIATIPAIERRVRTELPEVDGVDGVLAAMAEGDPRAAAIIHDVARAAGQFAGTAAAFTLPEAVVVGGELAFLVERGRAAFDDGVAHVRPDAAALPVIVREHDFAYWARGAATLAIQHSVLDSAI